jgi:hypothetical protein
MTVIERSVPRKPSANTGSVVLRLPESWLARADALIEYLADRAPGVELTRSDALRAALAAGFDVLEAKAKKKTRK